MTLAPELKIPGPIKTDPGISLFILKIFQAALVPEGQAFCFRQVF
jgi:hypothetical protein